MLFDKVIGVIGDQVILWSTIEEELRAIEESGTPMTYSERNDRRMRILVTIARNEIWVQYGKVIGGQSPEEFKAVLDRYVAERMAEQQQRFGSFTRFDEELRNIGDSRSSLETRLRNKLLSDYGRSNAPGQRSPLMVTPKEIRRYFDQNPERFSIQSTADYERMFFPLDLADVDQRMAAAAEAWAKDGADPEQIAAQFGGRVRAGGQVLDDHADSIKSFALNASPGQVSQPIRLGRYYWLYKVTSRTYAREELFTDPEVQKRIKFRLREQMSMEARNRVIQQNGATLLIWPPELRNALNGR